MRINLYATHYPVCSARYAAGAFTRLGHTVRHYGASTGTRIWGLDVDERHVWQPDAHYEDADLHIVMDSDPAVLSRAASIRQPVIVWGVDNHVRDYRRPYFRHYFLAHRHASVMAWKSSRLRYTETGIIEEPSVQMDEMTWLPCGFDPAVFLPSPIPYAERAYDVCMIGVMYPRRVQLLERMKAAGLKVLGGTGLLYDDMARAYQNSRVSLCVSANDDLAQRVFETAAAGCCVLTDQVADLVAPDTNNALGLQGFATFVNDDEAVERALELARGNAAQGASGAAMLQRIVWQPTGDIPFPRHSWDARAQVIVDWFTHEYGGGTPVAPIPTPMPELPRWRAVPVAVVDDDDNPPMTWTDVQLPTGADEDAAEMAGKPYLNLGCGRVILPGERPAHHGLVDEAIYAYPHWHNVDRNATPGVDEVADVFAYPFPFADNSFDGALLTHLVEHIPHDIRLHDDAPLQAGYNLTCLQDGWYAFFAELYRVLTPGAKVHILSPYAWSAGAVTDPTHTRLITEHTFTHSMRPEPEDNPFEYATGGIHFEMAQPPMWRITPLFAHLADDTAALAHALQTQLNVAYELYVVLEVVK